MKLFTRRRPTEAGKPPPLEDHPIPLGARVVERHDLSRRGTVLGHTRQDQAWVVWDRHPNMIGTVRPIHVLVLPFAATPPVSETARRLMLEAERSDRDDGGQGWAG